VAERAQSVPEVQKRLQAWGVSNRSTNWRCESLTLPQAVTAGLGAPDSNALHKFLSEPSEALFPAACHGQLSQKYQLANLSVCL
jgi:hypothetical protein